MTSPVVSSQPRRKSRSLIISIALIIIAAFVLAVSIWTTSGNKQADSAASAQSSDSTHTQSAQSASATPGASSAAAAAADVDPNVAAPSEKNAELLAIIRSAPKRDANDNQAKGALDAPVVLTLFSDFSCPYCTLFAKEIEPRLADLIEDGTLRIEWRDLAQITPTSPLAAQAGRAAADQGKFWEFHDLLYQATNEHEHPEYTEESLVAFAEQAGVSDIDTFRATMNAAETVQAVADAKKEAYSIGITGTPFMFIGDAYISGYRDYEYVRTTIELQAEAARS